VFGVAQPTISGLETCLKSVIENLTFERLSSSKSFSQANLNATLMQEFKQMQLHLTNDSIDSLTSHSQDIRIIWLNLREEPVIYIHDDPFVLRDQYASLRNIQSFAGITGDRLELLESRLKEDTVTESRNYNGRILLHEESDGETTPIWHEVESENIKTIREVFECKKIVLESREDGRIRDAEYRLEFFRVPITAEDAPESGDFDQILQILAQFDMNTSGVVLNCQQGSGRSTLGMVIVSQIINWMNRQTRKTELKKREMNAKPLDIPEEAPVKSHKRESSLSVPSEPKLSRQGSSSSTALFPAIHSLLRVIRFGLECKEFVDDIIESCHGVPYGDIIMSFHSQAAGATDETEKRRAILKGVVNLKRYFLLICFQTYLDQTRPDLGVDEMETFSLWMKRHDEIGKLLRELDEASNNKNQDILLPVNELQPGEGMALSTEIVDVVEKRSGSVLAPFTILKYDHFPGCQKLSLKEKVEGAPNFRRVVLSMVETNPETNAINFSSVDDMLSTKTNQIVLSESLSYVYGIGMPTKDGLRRTLATVNAHLDGTRTLIWTCLREEPVIFVNGKPFVLRTLQDPVSNLETTGIVRDRLELLEARLKQDILQELKLYNGKLLLHEEEVGGNSLGYTIVPVWESVSIENVETTKEVFEAVRKEGFKVNYLRIPITDEQAPIPNVFDQLIDRVEHLQSPFDSMFNCQMGRGR
jgi:protein-tyrosine phosphatase